MSTQAQHHSNGNRQSERRHQAQREGPLNNFRKLGELVDVPTDHENLVVWQWMDGEPHLLHLAAAVADPNHRGVGRRVRRNARRQAFYVAREATTVGTEQARDLDATGILAQSIVDLRQPLLWCIGCEDPQLFGQQGIVLGHHVGGRLPIDEAEQYQGAQPERTGDDERPAKRGGARKIRQAHGG